MTKPTKPPRSLDNPPKFRIVGHFDPKAAKSGKRTIVAKTTPSKGD
jgi:hypothetical protein